MSFIQKHWFKLVIVVIVIGIAAAWWIQRNGLPEGSKLPVIKQATAFQLEASDGVQTALKDGDGKVRLVYFFWSSCPDVCQPTTYELSKVQEELQKDGSFGKDVMIYSVSFDPERDTKEHLTQYAAKFKADPAAWKFLRGEPKTIVELGKNYGVAIRDMGDGTFAHTNAIALVDREGNIRKYITASEEDITYKRIVNDIRKVLKEDSVS